MEKIENNIIEVNEDLLKNMKYSVQVVILNEKGETLCVSRKDDHSDFGLVGGKVDPEDLSPEDAIVREVKEETGLNIKKEDLHMIFSMFKDGYMGYTYLCMKYTGELFTNEPHVLKWTHAFDPKTGSFGEWNQLVYLSLNHLGIKYKSY